MGRAKNTVGQHMTGLQPIVANFKDNFHVSMEGNINSKWVHLNGIHYNVRNLFILKKKKVNSLLKPWNWSHETSSNILFSAQAQNPKSSCVSIMINGVGFVAASVVLCTELVPHLLLSPAITEGFPHIQQLTVVPSVANKNEWNSVLFCHGLSFNAFPTNVLLIVRHKVSLHRNCF